MIQHTNAKLVMALMATAVMQLCPTAAKANVDEVAAKKLARADHCLLCHAITKKKEGPSYQSIAKKYSGNPEAVDILYKHLTAHESIVMSDGHRERHKVAKAKNSDDIKNLIVWILVQ